MVVAGQNANMCYFALYTMWFQKIIVYNIPAVGKEGLLASCDLMPFEVTLYETYNFDTDVIFFLVLT